MDAEVNECLWLVHNGIPPRVAFDMTDDELAEWMAKSVDRRQWMAIKFSEFAGAKFNLDTMEFEERQTP